MRWVWIVIAVATLACGDDAIRVVAPSPPPPSTAPVALAIDYVISRSGEAIVIVTALDAGRRPVPNVRIAFGCNHHGVVTPHAATSSAAGTVHTTVTAVGRVTLTAHVTAPVEATSVRAAVTLTL